MLRTCTIVIASLVTSACGTIQDLVPMVTGSRQPASSVCITTEKMQEREVTYLKRKMEPSLTAAGFKVNSDSCEISVVYERVALIMGSGVSVNGFTGAASIYPTWNEEGTVRVLHGTRLLKQDIPVVLQGYDTSMQLLDDLATTLVRQVTRRFVARQ
jgi:hypothetical protein